MLYLFCLKQLSQPLMLSQKRKMYLTNIESSTELNFFITRLLSYDSQKIGIIQNFLKKDDNISKIVKISYGLDFETYVKNRYSHNKEIRENFKEQEKMIVENHNILNVILFGLSFINFNRDLIENNIYIENFDSNKYSKLQTKISIHDLSNSLYEYLNLTNIESDLVEIFQIFDLNYSHYAIDNFIYIGELLNLYNSTQSKEFQFVQLAGIIEFLLIKGEKEITQQFKFKTCLIIERLQKISPTFYGKTFTSTLGNSEEIINILDVIYDIRSCIAHGNFSGISDKKSKMHKFKEKSDNNLQELINFDFFFRILQDYTSAILYSYIYEPEFIKLLKSN